MKLRPVEAEAVIKALGRIGFHPVRQRGSHLIMKHPDGRSTVIPVHPGEELGRGILMEIMSDVRMRILALELGLALSRNMPQLLCNYENTNSDS